MSSFQVIPGPLQIALSITALKGTQLIIKIRLQFPGKYGIDLHGTNSNDLHKLGFLF